MGVLSANHDAIESARTSEPPRSPRLAVDPAASRAGPSKAERALLACGAAASVVYVAADVTCALAYPGYSSWSQAVSELSAIGAPTQALWRVFGIAFGVLLVAFAIGLWRVGATSRRLRVIAALQLAVAAIGAVWPPMHQRGDATTLTDTLHLVWAGVTSLLILASIGFSAGALGRRFRRFAIATLVAMLVLGAATFAFVPAVDAGEPTPGMGALERANLGAWLVWMGVLSVTTALHGAREYPRGIAERGYRLIGGIEQWVMIRGADLANPPLVMLHGGPGLGETSFFRHFNRALEERFTVVCWDQRGAGKTARRDHSHAPLTVERMIADLDELVDLVRARLGHAKVTIFGHSWGSALGVLYTARFPEKVAAYAGSGQIGDAATAEAASYAYALAEAERQGDHAAVAELQAIGPPPHTPSAMWIERNTVARLDGRAHMLWALLRALVADPDASMFEIPGAMRTFRRTIDEMWAEVSRLDLRALAPSLAVPVFLFLGRRDHWVPPEASVAYLEALAAPARTLLWFEGSGHEPFVDEPAKFNRAMIELVRPAAVTSA